MEKLDAHSAEFRQFFLVHYETLCIRAFRLVHDRNLSEDIVQDVFLMLWKRRTEIDFSRPVLPYLTTAVRNRSIDSSATANRVAKTPAGSIRSTDMSAAWLPTAAKRSSIFRGFGMRSTTACRSSPNSAGASFC